MARRWALGILLMCACLEAPPEGPVDLPGQIDSGTITPGDAVTQESCEAQFGEAPDFLLCEETPVTCKFVASSYDTNRSCDQICGMFGATCETGFDADGIGDCKPEAEDGCAEDHQSMICVCSRG